MKHKQLMTEWIMLVCCFLKHFLGQWLGIFDEFLDRARSGSSAVEKSHGTRLSDQSIDDTIRKPMTTKPASDEAKISEPFDVNPISPKLLHL